MQIIKKAEIHNLQKGTESYHYFYIRREEIDVSLMWVVEKMASVIGS